MAELFADLPAALANSVEIARRCSLPLKLGTSKLPVFPVPDGRSAEDYIRSNAATGLAARLAAKGVDAVPEQYAARLSRELDVICSMGFASYFLIVADFIRWAREKRCARRPGARFRRRFAGGLGAGHHRPRSHRT